MTAVFNSAGRVPPLRACAFARSPMPTAVPRARLCFDAAWRSSARTDWSDAQKAVFLQTQFGAQHAHYQKHYVGTDFFVIQRGDEPVGRLYLARWERQHRIVDIALLPAHRGAGLGEAIVLDLIDEAAAAGKARHHPRREVQSRAVALCRLGFVEAGEEGAYDLMRWEK